MKTHGLRLGLNTMNIRGDSRFEVGLPLNTLLLSHKGVLNGFLFQRSRKCGVNYQVFGFFPGLEFRVVGPMPRSHDASDL